MKIKRFKVSKIPLKPLIDGIELSFPDGTGDFLSVNCLIGVNGSGKSQYLETIAETFIYLDAVFRTINSQKTVRSPFSFELDYEIEVDNSPHLVTIQQDYNATKLPTVEIFDGAQKLGNVSSSDIFLKYLPEKVIGYTSGENETISIPFRTYYDNYADYTGTRAIQGSTNVDYEPRFYFMDYSTNLGIVISNLVFDDSEGIKYIKKQLQLKNLKSFQIILQTNQVAAPKINSKSGEKGIVLTDELKQWREYLINSSTCYDFDRDRNQYILDFLFNDATKAALTHFFKNAYGLYTALYKFELLNNLIVDARTRKGIERERKNRRLITKMPTVPNKDKVLHYSELKLELTTDECIDYLSLSDGEHQFFNIFGTILMIDQRNSLFLLDEPETHFNPKWRRLFVSHLRSLTKGRKQNLFLTSHSPFIVSDTARESVFIFNRVAKDKIEVLAPHQETFGASFDNILMMAFKMDEIISQEALNSINALKREEDPAIIEKGLLKLGESPQLMALYRRIEMLSQKKK